MVIFSSSRAVAQTFHKIQISNDADDGFYDANNGSGWHSVPENSNPPYNGPNADWVGSWGGTTNAWVIGYRFPSTGINSGDTIQSAYLELVSSDNDASSATCGQAPCANTNSTFRVYGVAQDNGAAFSNTAGNTPVDVPYTSAFVDYTTTGPGDVHGSCQGQNQGQNTCTHVIDVSNIVREITSRPGWSSSSAIRFVMKSMDPSGPNIRAGFEDSSANSARAATLVVNPTLPFVVSSGAWGSSATNQGYPTAYQLGPYVYSGASTLLLFLGDYYIFNGLTVDQPAISDSCGNAWSILDGPADYASYFYELRSTIYYVQNPVPCAAGATINITADNPEPIFSHFLAVSGSNTAQTPIISAIANPGAPALYTTTASTNAVTMSSSGLLVSWAFGDSDAPHTFTPQAGFTTDINSTPNYLTTVYQSVSAGTYSNTFSISPSDGWQAVLIGLTPSSGGAPVPPTITSATGANGTVGTAFSYQITATNSPTSYNATGLPAGLSVDTSTGLISGTPTAVGTSTVTISATNSGGTATAILTLTIAAQAPVITSATTASGTVGTAFSYQITATNSPTSYNATGLPAGLSVDTSTGLISGTPTAAGTLTVTLSATNSGGTGTGSLTITIAAVLAPVITSSATANGTVGSAFSFQIAATNSPTSYGAAGLPAGLSVNTSTGLISGIPSTAGISRVSISATNTGGTGTGTLTLTVTGPTTPTITWPTPPAITYGTALSATQLNATSSVQGTFAYTPAQGTLLAAGTYTLSVTFTPNDTTNYTTATQTVQLVVNRASQAISFVLPSSASLSSVSLSLSATGGASSNPVTFNVVSGPGTISGNSLTFTGTGTVVVAANQAGSANYLAAAQVTQSVTVVNTPILTVSANDATRVYGAANPAFTGSVTGALNGDSFTESFSTAATVTSNTGTYPIVPNVAGQNLASYTVVVQNGTLTITKAGSTVSLAASSGSVASGQSVTLTAAVASATTGTPTGTVTFFDGSAQLGTSALSSGTASFATASLASGATHSLTATYSGDGNFGASTTAAPIPIIVGGPDFTLAVVGSSSATVTAGNSASYQLTANPTSGNYPGTVTFTATGLPVGATAIFNPSSIASNAGQQTVTATIQTSAGTSMNVGSPARGPLATISLAFLLMPLLGIARIRRNWLNRMLVLIVLLGGIGVTSSLSGCGAGGVTIVRTSQSYNVTITATGGGAQHSVTVALNIQ